MPLAAEYKFGNTVVSIYDDECCTDPAEIEAILKRIGQIAASGSRKKERPSEPKRTASTKTLLKA